MSTEFHTIGLMGRTLDPLISDTVHSIARYLREHGRTSSFFHEVVG